MITEGLGQWIMDRGKKEGLVFYTKEHGGLAGDIDEENCLFVLWQIVAPWERDCRGDGLEQQRCMTGTCG